MKRTSPLQSQGIRSSNPFDNLSIEQLAYIGAIAMLFNDLEDLIDEMCGRCIIGSIHNREITSRINGIEGKVEIAKHAARQWDLSDQERAVLGDTLGKAGFLELKGLRDAVVHGRVFDFTTSIARTRARQGKVADILLHIDALKGLFQRMEEMRVELSCLEDILNFKRRIKQGGIEEKHRARLESDIQMLWVRLHQHRAQRLALPPMPDWPEDRLNIGVLRAETGQKPG